MENEEICADEISEIESTELHSDSETDSDTVTQFMQRHTTQIIYDSESSDSDYQTDNQWTKYDPKRNVEMFTGISGVKLHPNNPQSISEIVELVIEDDFIEMVAIETNRYYDQMHRRYKCGRKTKEWYDTTVPEMKKFFALIILMGQVQKTTIHDYWSTRPSIETPFFSKIMTRHRFLQILRFLHFSNNTEMASNPSRLCKIQPVINYLLNKFSTVYKPEQELSLDEVMIPYRGRLSFSVYNPSKITKYGILVRMLSEASTGYLCNFQLYCGRGDPLEKTISHLLNKSENLWHHVYMDNYYNSITLAESLLTKKIRICGTIRKNRGFPKDLNDLRLRIGEFDFRRKGEVLVLKWKDKQDVRMISTIHNADVVETGKINQKTGQQVRKPECIMKYNQHMKGVHQADQYLSYYSFLRKSIKWTKKVFMFLLHCTFFNSFILYRKLNPHTNITFSKFLQTLAEEWISSATEHHDTENLPSSSTALGRAPHFDPPYRLSGDMKTHQLERIAQTGKLKYPQKRCRVCKTRGIRRDTSYICKLCKIPLCKNHCFSIYHTSQKY
ncbi:piggyBac transposable element-derived protein 4 [Orussus abietinus]|uniref:piggyBac transposable element-derived protein 4 n=1 Tax=Orussus abietinus TaxID=222816 RepID=UPI0006251291|nr:piggyBac transposable element-derived protein 4 [Orussus abietinus]XP_012277178.1 piggyBac transposable element-derived protein 4 [Orussus abietinus]XP_012277179.1 piggyBac transposable element-derived protein 4 [Orussus abietinus]XP_023290474.1 piggyBac transposable element-derived protein 4 [Orussus abietinus]